MRITLKIVKVSPDDLGMSEMFLHPMSPVGAKCSNFLIRASKVWVSLPPLRVPTTQPAVIEWQNNIHSSPPHSQNFGAKSRKQPLRLLSEPPKIGFHIASLTFAVRICVWLSSGMIYKLCDLRHVHYNALTISYEQKPLTQNLQKDATVQRKGSKAQYDGSIGTWFHPD